VRERGGGKRERREKREEEEGVGGEKKKREKRRTGEPEEERGENYFWEALIFIVFAHVRRDQHNFTRGFTAPAVVTARRFTAY